MNRHPMPQYRTLLTVDIEDYSSRTDAEQRVLQSALMTALDYAADAAELNQERWDRQFGGDGLIAVLPPETDIPHLLDVLVRRLDAQLGLYNRLREQTAWTRIRVRLALHVGPIHIDGDSGWPGQHAVLPARLRDAQPIRAALAARSGADLAVIVSEEIYRNYVTQGPGNPRPTEFRAVRVKEKKQSYTAYLYLPGYDVHAITALAPYDVDKPSSPDGTAPSEPKPQPHPSGGGISAGRDVINGMSNRVEGGGTINISGERQR